MKNGATAITISIMTVFCTTLLCVCLVYVIECITPFILHQKLQAVATKYMYVIERYGYLTNEEKNSMLEELKSKGFEETETIIEYPDTKKNYGELLELKITYKYISKIKSIPILGTDHKNLVVSRVSYSKM